MSRFRFLCVLLMLALSGAGCAGLPFPFPQQQADQAATAVAQTLAAIPVPTQEATPVPVQPSPAPSATAVPKLLPHSLYFLRNDKGGLLQVFRLANDGKTLQQITFEPAPVDGFDVSPADGSVAYGSNNQLLLVDNNGAGRRTLVDGGPVDKNNPWLNSLGNPVWSPDGKIIAFGHNGLNFYAIDTGAVTQVLQNQSDTSAGFPIAKELYSPNRYSPDGSRLLVNIGYYEGGTFAIYELSTKTLLKFNSPTAANICCEVRWVPDGSGLYEAGSTIGMVDSGLAYVSADTAQVNVLLPGSAPDGTYNFAAGPQVGRDGKLYFFFNNLPQIPTGGHTPLSLYRADTDGVKDRTQLKKDAWQNLNEVLWAPDASLAVVAEGPTADVYSGGVLSVVYPDDRPDLQLVDFGQDLHWGP